MEWQLPVVLTAEMMLEFFHSEGEAVDRAVEKFALEVAPAFAKIKKNFSACKSPQAGYASVDAMSLLENDCDETARSPGGNCMAAGISDRGQRARHSGFFTSPHLPTALESLMRTQMKLMRVPWTKSFFAAGIRGWHLRKYITPGSHAAVATVSVPLGEERHWTPLDAIAADFVAANAETKRLAKARMLAEHEARSRGRDRERRE